MKGLKAAVIFLLSHSFFGCEPGGVINVLFENPSVSRFFLCILQSSAGNRIAFMPLFGNFFKNFRTIVG